MDNTELSKDLAACVEALEKATPGELHAELGGFIYSPTHKVADIRFAPTEPERTANAYALTNCVNFLRTHAPAIAELQARCEAAERDAERMRQDAREIYAQIPQLPITTETCDAATDAITRFCIDFNDAIDASREVGNG